MKETENVAFPNDIKPIFSNIHLVFLFAKVMVGNICFCIDSVMQKS